MSKDILERCCYCYRVKDWNGVFNDNIVIDQKISQYAKDKYSISDGICPDCLKKQVKLIKIKEGKKGCMICNGTGYYSTYTDIAGEDGGEYMNRYNCKCNNFYTYQNKKSDRNSCTT